MCEAKSYSDFLPAPLTEGRIYNISCFPALTIRDIGVIGLPLNSIFIETLRNRCSYVPEGQFFEISAPIFSIDNWTNSVDKIRKQIQEEMHLPQIDLVLSKLVLQEKNNTYRSDVDDREVSNIIGTLLIQLPSIFTGSQLVVHLPDGDKASEIKSHNGTEETFTYWCHVRGLQCSFSTLQSGCRTLAVFHILKPQYSEPLCFSSLNKLCELGTDIKCENGIKRILLEGSYTERDFGEKGIFALCGYDVGLVNRIRWLCFAHIPRRMYIAHVHQTFTFYMQNYDEWEWAESDIDSTCINLDGEFVLRDFVGDIEVPDDPEDIPIHFDKEEVDHGDMMTQTTKTSHTYDNYLVLVPEALNFVEDLTLDFGVGITAQKISELNEEAEECIAAARLLLQTPQLEQQEFISEFCGAMINICVKHENRELAIEFMNKVGSFMQIGNRNPPVFPLEFLILLNPWETPYLLDIMEKLVEKQTKTNFLSNLIPADYLTNPLYKSNTMGNSLKKWIDLFMSKFEKVSKYCEDLFVECQRICVRSGFSVEKLMQKLSVMNINMHNYLQFYKKIADEASETILLEFILMKIAEHLDVVSSFSNTIYTSSKKECVQVLRFASNHSSIDEFSAIFFGRLEKDSMRGPKYWESIEKLYYHLFKKCSSLPYSHMRELIEQKQKQLEISLEYPSLYPRMPLALITNNWPELNNERVLSFLRGPEQELVIDSTLKPTKSLRGIGFSVSVSAVESKSGTQILLQKTDEIYKEMAKNKEKIKEKLNFLQNLPLRSKHPKRVMQVPRNPPPTKKQKQ